MDLEAIAVDKLRELAKYLDEFPTSMPGSNEEEFWRLLIKKLPRQMYSRDQVEEFAEEVQSISGSPSLRLLYDMRGKKLVKFEQLLAHLKAIKCHKAINMFTPTKIPVFKEHPQSSVQTREGETVVLSCAVECVPSPPLYQWFHNRTPLAHENNSHLILKNIHQGHNGLYCCRATNPHINNESEKHVFSEFTKLSVSQFPVQESTPVHRSGKSCGMEVHNQAKPTVSGASLMVRDIANSDVTVTKEPPSNLTVHYNDTFKLECNAKSRSGKKLTYKWIRIKPGQREELGSGPELESSWTRAGTIHIQCEITNENGEKVFFKEVQVKVITVWFTEQPQNVRASSNEKVMLTCKAEGKTPVRFIWFNSSLRKSKKKIIPGSNNDVLVIDAATVHDTGFYSCQAEVEGDIVNSETVEVQVGDRKDVFIIRHPRSYVCVKGKSLTLSCEVNGGPTYLWYHNDVPMNGEMAAELHIPEVTDETFGTYKCRVTGSNDDDQEFTKTVKVVPGVSEDSQTYGHASIQLDQMQAESEFKTASGMYYAREKLALLLGNQDYESDKIANLTSPINDITKLRETLEQLNFKVFAFANLKLEETNKVLNRFCELLVDAGMYAVFYYAGHGFEYQNVDYIMPVNAQLPLKCDECYSVNYIAAKLQERKSKVFMFLDSCRVSYGSSKVEGPTSSRQQSHCAFSNLYKVSSCVARQPAFEKSSDECSVFNKALREGLLAEGKDLEEVISDTMSAQGQSKAGGAYQRPVFLNRLLPRKITLRDEILWDNMMMNESAMAEVENTWEAVHSMPKPIDLLSKSNGRVSGSVQFCMVLSNVMIVTAEFTARARFIQPTVTLNTDKLRSQKVIVVQTCDEEGKASYRISDLERHKDGKLDLEFRVSVVTPQATGEEKLLTFIVNHRINKFTK